MKKLVFVFLILVSFASKAQLAKNTTINQISITKDSTIDLNGTTLTLTNTSRLFNVPSGTTLTIKNGKILPKLSFKGMINPGSTIIWKNVNNSEGFLKLQ